MAGNRRRGVVGAIGSGLGGVGWITLTAVALVSVLGLLSLGLWRLAVVVFVAGLVGMYAWPLGRNHLLRRSTVLRALISMPMEDFEMSMHRALRAHPGGNARGPSR